jgi:hypothetical protein
VTDGVRAPVASVRTSELTPSARLLVEAAQRMVDAESSDTVRVLVALRSANPTEPLVASAIFTPLRVQRYAVAPHMAAPTETFL